jgi:hypothetical protein
VADFESVRLKFDGGIAAGGRIYLYEYSRSQYGLSRFITITEQFRRTGEVIDRVTASKAIDLIVAVPERGSFLLDVLVPTLTPVASELVQVPFKSLFAYIWARLLPHNEKRDAMAVELARIELAREQERTRQLDAAQTGETERLRILREIIRDQSATTQQALDLVDRALQRPDQAMARAGYEPEQLIQERQLIAADLVREKTLEETERQVEKLDPKRVNQLTNKLRPMVSEIGLPLRSSAAQASIGDAEADDAFIRLDADRLAEIGARNIDDTEFEVECNIRSYDKFTGRGKVESDEFEKTMFFLVEPHLRGELRDVILQAMRRRSVTCTFASYKDAAENITSLILRAVKF